MMAYMDIDAVISEMVPKVAEKKRPRPIGVEPEA
jgi:hypothetical protein